MIDVIVVNYNDYNTTKEFINHHINFEIIDSLVVVDNQSTDDSYEKLKMIQNSKLVVIKTDMNGGYGYGNNVGIKYIEKNSSNKNILIANPDTIVTEDVLRELDRFLLKNSKYAIAVPLLCNPDKEPTYKDVWPVISPFKYVLTFGVVYSVFSKSIYYNKEQMMKQDVVDVDCVSGCLLMGNRAKLLEVGPYDENLFLYGEESLLGYNLKKKGYKSALLPDLRFMHMHSVSINKTYKTILSREKLMVESKRYVTKQMTNNPIIIFLSYVWSIIRLMEFALITVKEKIMRGTK